MFLEFFSCVFLVVSCLSHKTFFPFVVFVSWTKIVNFLWSFFGSSFGASVINTYFPPENYQLMHYAQHRQNNGSYILCALTKTKRRNIYKLVLSFEQWSCWNLARVNDVEREERWKLAVCLSSGTNRVRLFIVATAQMKHHINNTNILFTKFCSNNKISK